MRLIPTTPTETYTPQHISIRPLRVGELREARILDFDVETVAAGFADPDWVPQKITCVAWSWVGLDTVESRVCGPTGLFGNPKLRAGMLRPLLEVIEEADMVTGHNINRFDLPVINAECMRLGLKPIEGVVSQDTIRVFRSKGFKKGQDVLGRTFNLRAEKQTMNWQDWQDAYDEKGWEDIRRRAETDVIQHKELRAEMIERDILRAPVFWRAR